MNYELIACNNFCKVLPDLTSYITESMVSAGEERMFELFIVFTVVLNLKNSVLSNFVYEWRM